MRMSDIDDDGSVERRRELVGALRAADFKIANLEMATGADSAKIIGDLRMKLAQRHEDVHVRVRYMQDTYPYTAPENVLPLFMAFAERINDMLQRWEEEDAAASDDVSCLPGQAS
jgi:hypothetical protein